MTGMILGLASLVAWGLSRFQSLMGAVKISGTPGSAAYTAAYSHQLSLALHQVYTDIFAAAAIIMLLGAVPALFLWRPDRSAPEEEPHYESFVAPLG
jgi:hypothetical protein